jgi:hypothetical protein
MFEFKKNVGLLISMHDEVNVVYNTLMNVVGDCGYVGIVQSGNSRASEVDELLTSKDTTPCDYKMLEYLGDDGSGWHLTSEAVCRNYSALFNGYREANVGEAVNVDYLLCITGDTLLWNMWGVDTIIDGMIEKGCDVGCSRALGQSFHSADLTSDHFKSGGEGGGRLQDSSNDDFMPQMFIVGKNLVDAFSDIQVTNEWCSEQCLADAMNKHKGLPYVFSWEAYGFADGVVYNYSSDMYSQ